MTRTFKVLSLLLSYPDETIKAGAAELKLALEEEALLPKQRQQYLCDLIDEIAARDLYDLQERYVLLFDRTRSLSLHMFEHVHGEGRDRGQAMLDLKSHYERHGYEIAACELPDFLPLFLEFLSTLPPKDSKELLGEPIHIIAALRKRLQRRGSIYASVFLALEAIARGKPSASSLKRLLNVAEDDPNDFSRLDEVWEEEAVTFGPVSSADGCNPNRIAARLRAAKRPAPGLGSN